MLIYKITNLVNGKIYVGYTINTMEKRWKSHVKEAKADSVMVIHNAIRKYGEDSFTMIKLCSCKDLNKLLKLEDFFIKKLKSKDPNIGYNRRDGGYGGRVDEEGLKKISEKLKGRISPTKGMKLWNDEQRRQISERQTGEKSCMWGKKNPKASEHIKEYNRTRHHQKGKPSNLKRDSKGHFTSEKKKKINLL